MYVLDDVWIIQSSIKNVKVTFRTEPLILIIQAFILLKEARDRRDILTERLRTQFGVKDYLVSS